MTDTEIMQKQVQILLTSALAHCADGRMVKVLEDVHAAESLLWRSQESSTSTSQTEVLAARILGLIPTHPEILDMDTLREIIRIPGFHCSDINPTLGQALASLTIAKARYALTATP